MNITKMNYNDIQDKIEEYLPIKIKEKNKFGEVFTPITLINEMLDKLDNDIWCNPNLKWLDPANGIGNFPMVVYHRLNKGLKSVIENEEERKSHIIKNMLYMIELNEKNVNISQNIFGNNANIYCGSFLEDGWKDYFGIDKFDVIVGNPPFNKERVSLKGTNAGKVIIWDKFIIKALDCLKPNGYLGFINPAGWRSLGKLHHLWITMIKKEILYIHIYGVNDGNKYFNVGSRFDLYVLQNTDNTKPTEVIDELGETHQFKLNDMPFLPNYGYREIGSILTNIQEGVDVIYDTSYHTSKKHMSKTKTEKFKYPIVHSITNKGLVFWYSDINEKGHFGVPKVILNKNGNQYSYKEQNDYDGKFGMSELSFGLPIKSKREGDLILKAIETPIFKKIIAGTKWATFQTDYRMFKYFRKDWYKFS